MIRQAQWISCCEDIASPVISRHFHLTNPTGGTIELTGLGYFRLFINGRSVTDELMNPAVSDYEPRDLSRFTYPLFDQTTHRIYYRRYDISDFLSDGENHLEIMLGNGWYRQNERVAEGPMSFGKALKAIYALKVTDAEGEQLILSDGSETCAASHILESNLFLGEVQDAQLIGKAQPARPVAVLQAPEAELTLQTCPSDRIIRTITPVLLSKNGDTAIYDAGENISGRVSILTKGLPGEQVSLVFSEELSPDGRLDFTSTGSDYICASDRMQIQSDTFICGESALRMAPEFVWHAFRYFSVTGPGSDPIVEVIHTDVPVTSAFRCDHEGLNWLYDAFIRTALDNMHGSIPSDCPHRERLGYTGDGQATAESLMLLTDSRAFYRKWIQDILDCQDILSGHIQHTAPLMGGGGGPGGWGSAIVIVPYRYFRCFGDTDLPETCYPHMAKWVSYMEKHSKNGLVVREEEGGWCLGDWAMPGKPIIPEPFVNSCFFVKCLDMLAEMAGALGKTDDVPLWQEKSSLVRTALVREYYDAGTGSFCGGVQGADAYALDLRLVDDPRTIENLDAKYRALGCFDTGFLGTDILIDVLLRHGRINTAFNLLTTEKDGGFMWMKRVGATTIWEYIDEKQGWPCSHNHPMYGAVTRQLFTRFLGIRQPDSGCGYHALVIAPVIPDGLNFAEGYLTLPCGKVAAAWTRKDNAIELQIEIPAGTSAQLHWKHECITLTAGVSGHLLYL